MPLIEKTGLDAWSEAKGPSKGWHERAELRVAIASLEDNEALRVMPDDGNLRKLKVMVRWAANEVDKKVRYMEDTSGNLIVRLAPPEVPVEGDELTPRRGRPRRKPAETEESATEG